MAQRTAAGLIRDAVARLRGLPNPSLDAEMLFRGVSGWSRADLLTRAEDLVPQAVAEAFEAAVARREGHEPVQYILGKAAFWHDEFVVNPAVLIPRPDTEILVEAVAKRTAGIPAPRLLDVGTGSGCIALSLLRESPDALAVGLDLSPDALEIARLNAQRLGLTERVEFRPSRWLDGLNAGEAFDAIVSNPPYVARADEATLAPEVRDHEPALALFADPDDDLSSYRAILDGLRLHLRPSGLLAFEVGLGQADRVARLIEAAGFQQVEVIDDLAGIPRVVLGRRG
jgi:release factor glutamine methyltransferase